MVAVRKIDLQDGDVLQLGEGAFPPAELPRFIDQLRHVVGERRVMVIMGDVRQLSEADMNAAGWYRK
ncbi:hypothetical protein SAMN02745857_01773 [Andreprevotia lacus DSM 23236]|jgi:hypothetical protein|uniref:Uncharacterized protein n=2 Tax=Andreprevotia TaxID=397275 RepID=A0A1W1XK81_9NEIS|nr:hypothetical protein SAMN02745857_01773 [Andreprevotia lacus DSM 23236]